MTSVMLDPLLLLGLALWLWLWALRDNGRLGVRRRVVAPARRRPDPDRSPGPRPGVPTAAEHAVIPAPRSRRRQRRPGLLTATCPRQRPTYWM